MRQIPKGAEPHELANWKAENAALPELLSYESLHGDVKQALRSAMLAEQGYLCGYTMVRVATVDECHIEHIIPQNQIWEEDHSWGRTLEYSNMIVCFPGNRPPPAWSPTYPYGATLKSGTHVDAETFVSPLSDGVEARFAYRANGVVESAKNEAGELTTIQTLGLNQAQLVELRKAAIDEAVLDADLSADQAIDLANQILKMGPGGQLSEFCLAIAQVARWYAGYRAVK